MFLGRVINTVKGRANNFREIVVQLLSQLVAGKVFEADSEPHDFSFGFTIPSLCDFFSADKDELLLCH